MKEIYLNDSDIGIKDFESILNGAKILFDESLKLKITASESLLKKQLKEDKTIYGVNTGYGFNCTQLVGEDGLEALQENLITYLKCGTGGFLSYKESKAIGYARLISISKGLSGVSLEMLERFRDLLELGVAPKIPKNGSLGASGDLIPLSYWANFIIGRGVVIDPQGSEFEASHILKENNFKEYKLKAKEGLSVVNGTSAMAGLAFINYQETLKLVEISSVLTSWSLMALNGWGEAFSPLVNEKAKSFKGQAEYARQIRFLIGEEDYDQKRSFDVKKLKEVTERPLQDRYSIRCAPQIMGPLLDTLKLGSEWITKEINGVSDNPIFDSEEEEIDVVMGGNFYGGYMAHLMDYLKISLYHMNDMTDRQLLLVMDKNTNQGLPVNLVNPALAGLNANLHHGLKGLHQSASAITSEIGALCMPNSIFSRSSETHNQDKVSLGFSACKQYAQMIELSFEVVALAAICFAQALDIRGVKLKGSRSKTLYNLVRERIPFVEKDVALDESINLIVEDLKSTLI